MDSECILGTKVLVPSSDHSYYEAFIYQGTAIFIRKYNHWSEDYPGRSLEEGEERREVYVVE